MVMTEFSDNTNYTGAVMAIRINNTVMTHICFGGEYGWS
jgi:hypothetical protein